MQQQLRQLGGGVLIAMVSIVLVIGGISLALAESVPQQPEPPTQALPTSQLIFPSFTPLPTLTFPVIFTDTALPSATSTLAIAPTTCTTPSGWVQIIVGVNDTIYTLAQRYKTSEDAIKNGNCMPSYAVVAGAPLYVPFVPTAVVIPCGPPAGWVQTHVVQAGDNLYRIALSYGLSYPQLQLGNCMGSSITIYAGQVLWVPNIPTLTPVPGITVLPPTSTSTFITTPTNTIEPTSTFISTPSLTPVPPTNTPNTTTP